MGNFTVPGYAYADMHKFLRSVRPEPKQADPITVQILARWRAPFDERTWGAGARVVASRPSLNRGERVRGAVEACEP